MSSSSTLSPFDLSGLGAGFGLYRPRRPSYTYATQVVNRQRSESYRYAVRKGPNEDSEFNDVPKRTRKESYVRATRNKDETVGLRRAAVERNSTKLDSSPNTPIVVNSQNSKNDFAQNSSTDYSQSVNLADYHPPLPDAYNSNRSHVTNFTCSQGSDGYQDEFSIAVPDSNRGRAKPKHSPRRKNDINGKSNAPRHTEEPYNSSVVLSLSNENHVTTAENETGTPCSELSSNVPSIIVFTFKKNLVFLCISFITLFSSFRAVQNLQSTINEKNDLGIIAMSIIHGTMFMTSLWAPSIINKLSAKWALVLGMFSFLTWTGANMYPTFYTLIPTAIFSGFGQGILWTAEISYILKLAFDSSRVVRGNIDREVMRFHGIFLACFQTTHIWGNLISSLVLSFYKHSPEPSPIGEMMMSNATTDEELHTKSCGVLHSCNIRESEQMSGIL